MITSSAPCVLLVDDDPNDEELARIAFEDSQVPQGLVIKRDGAEAIQFLDGLSDDDREWPLLVMLDLKLPKVSGLEVLEHVRKNPRTRFLPVVVFTSSNEAKDLKLSYDLGANAYIRKPIDFDEYRKTVHDISRFWILRNQPPPRRGV